MENLSNYYFKKNEDFLVTVIKLNNLIFQNQVVMSDLHWIGNKSTGFLLLEVLTQPSDCNSSWNVAKPVTEHDREWQIFRLQKIGRSNVTFLSLNVLHK